MARSLRHVRASLGLTQGELAESAGVAKATVVQAEKGRVIKLLTAYAILNALNGELKQRSQQELEIGDLDWNLEQ